MNATQTATAAPATPVRIHAHHSAEKRLGHWTAARAFEVRARHGHVVLDLRSPRIPAGDIKVDIDLERAVVKLLVPEDAEIDHWDVVWTGRGKVKQTFHHGPAAGTGRRIRITGQVRRGEVRVHSGGVALLSAMFSREYVEDAKRARAEGGHPTVDDPTRTA